MHRNITFNKRKANESEINLELCWVLFPSDYELGLHSLENHHYF